LRCKYPVDGIGLRVNVALRDRDTAMASD
jgi:hypothetical protein